MISRRRRWAEKSAWAKAHAIASRLRSDRDELRTALSHLGLAILKGQPTFLSDVRQACGPHWFDRQYHHLLSGGKP